MQPIQVVKTIKWIINLAPEIVQKGFFLGGIARGQQEVKPDYLLRVTHEAASVIEKYRRNVDAVTTLKAFGLGKIFEPDYVSTLATTALLKGPDMHGNYWENVVVPWRYMTSSCKAWEELTIPKDLRGDTLPGDIISIEIRPPEGAVALDTVRSVIGYLERAYSAIALVFGDDPSEAKLAVVSIETGWPSIRIDCRGIAQIIKETKAFIIEAWHKGRHKRSEELLENNSALLSSLAVIEAIERRKKDNSLGPEQAETLKRTLVESALGLFDCHALPTDVRRHESVDNDKLLAQFSPRLLTAGDDGTKANEEASSDAPTPLKKKRRPRQAKQKPPHEPSRVGDSYDDGIREEV